MTTVIIGSNRIIDCESILQLDGKVVLKIEDDPLRVSLILADDPPRMTAIDIVDNEDRRGDPAARVVRDGTSVSVFYRGFPAVMATRLEPGVVHARIDLRKLGLVFYDDADGLHVGRNLVRSNVFTRCKNAIGLTSAPKIAAAG